MGVRGWLAEDLGEALLTRLGYRVVERRKVVRLSGVDVAEVDIVAEKEGVKYAVEVKAGKLSVTDVRQAYANAKLLGARPLVVCRGFSNEAARALAKALGVEVVIMDEYLSFVTVDELAEAVERALERALSRVLLAGIGDADERDERILSAIACSRSMEEAAEKLGMTTKELGREVGRLSAKGLLASSTTYRLLRAQAAVALDRIRLRKIAELLGR